MVMREMFHPSIEEERRVLDIEWSGMQKLSLSLAAATPHLDTREPEENVSIRFPKPAYPKTSQMFLTCPFCFTPVGILGKAAM